MQGPHYDDGNIVNLMASLQHALGDGGASYAPLSILPPDIIGAHRQVLLWIIDGLGADYLRRHRTSSELQAHLRGDISSVFPPTTATAITTYLTGDAPQQHGLTGWHMYLRELGGVAAVLPWRPRYGGPGFETAGIAPGPLLAHRPFSDRIAVPSHSVSPRRIADSPFNRAHLGRAELHSYDDLDGLIDHCVACLQAPGRRFVYAYWPELDSIGHHSGMHSDAAAAHLAALDRGFGQLLTRLAGTDTLVIVSADHGQVDVQTEDWIHANDHPTLRDCLLLPMCGEPRAAYCYLRPGSARRFDDYVADQLAGVADCRSGEELIDEGWFGPGAAHPQLRSRVGDRVLLMRDGHAIRDRLPHEQAVEMVGVHGGVSDVEMRVPLITASC